MKRELTRDEYKILVEKAPIVIWRAAVTMERDYFNEIWLAFIGRSMEQETGNGWAEGVHPEDFDKCLKIYTDHFTRRETFVMEYKSRNYGCCFFDVMVWMRRSERSLRKRSAMESIHLITRLP